MTTGVYCVANKITGDMYIGSTTNIQRRSSWHFCCLTGNYHNNDILQGAYNKYGKDAFEIRILLICSVDMLDYYEQQCITAFNSNYNKDRIVTPTGTRIMSAEARERISASMKGNIHLLGHCPSAETREKISKAAIGRKHSEETKLRISESHFGIRPSDETRAKLSANSATKGGLSEETKEKMRLAHLGVKRPPMSEEQKRKISDSRKKLFNKD